MNPRLGLRGTGLLLATMAAAWSCGGSSTSEPGSPAAGSSSTTATGSGSSTGTGAGGSTGSTTSSTTGDTTTSSTSGGGATTSGGGSGGASTSGSAGSTGMGGAGTGGSGTGGSGAGGSGMACSALTSVTLGVHVIMDVTWTGDNIKTKPGSGKVHIWNKSKLNINGTMVSGDETAACGSTLPEFELGTIGGVVVGGTKVQVIIPDAIWDTPTMPKFHSQGTLSAWAVGGQADLDPTVALVGVKMANPMGPWPTAAAINMAMDAVDADGDMKPGFTATSRNDSPYTNPPTATLGGAKADKLYLATRTVIALHGKLTSCEDISGTANVTMFDNHVVGCHVLNAMDCNASQSDFVDSSRTIYTPTGATFTAKKIPDGSNCAAVRAALPM
jgi:hypothetical protein